METQQRLFLRLEGLVIGLTGLWLYAQTDGGWLFFAILILAPDLFMLGYLINRKIGALVYNLGHSYVTVAAVFAIGTLLNWPLTTPIALIWLIHIGLDRLIGYGLKSTAGFKSTHLD